AGNPMLVYAENKHAQEAEQHLEKAVESGEKGDAKAAGSHTEEAKQHLMEENTETPYTKPAKHITGENPKAEHDNATFDEMRKAEGHAKKGEASEAAGHAKNASEHLKEKEQSK
ncbi:MAG: small metal-binding protein SmbP, partial [Nitrospira sp.]